MEQEIQGLSDRIERLLVTAKKLADENAKLRTDLTESRKNNAELQQRIKDARARVESALSRLPLLMTDES